jgi:hypothetical protein
VYAGHAQITFTGLQAKPQTSSNSGSSGTAMQGEYRSCTRLQDCRDVIAETGRAENSRQPIERAGR